MMLEGEQIDPPVEDSVSNVLKWVLLAVAILTFGLLAWATTVTYRAAPPQPERFLAADGYHHHLGLNIWGRPRQPQPAHALGLAEAVFARRGLTGAQSVVAPDGIALRLVGL